MLNKICFAYFLSAKFSELKRLLSILVVPTFEENGILKFGVVFFIQSNFGDRNNNF